MPARPPASPLLLIGVGAVFLGGITFGAVAALTQKRPATARTDPEPATTQEPPAAPTQPKKEEPKKEEPKKPDTKKEEPKKPDTKPDPKKPDPPKPDPKKPDPPKPDPKKPETVSVSYEKQVFPLFKTHCLLCHGDPQKKGNLDLKTLAKALEGGNNGPGATPGKLDMSTIWKEIDDGTMPPDGRPKMSAADKKLVKDWILAGAK